MLGLLDRPGGPVVAALPPSGIVVAEVAGAEGLLRILAIVVGAGSGIGGLARVDFGAMSNRAERSRTGPNVAPGGLSLRLDLVEHQVEFTPCSAAASRPEGGAAARTFRFHGLVQFLKIGFSLDAGAQEDDVAGSRGWLVVDSANALSPRFTFLAACSGPPTVVRFPRALDAYASAEI